MALTSIPVDSEVRDRLKKYGTTGMTYNDILTRLMDEIELEKFVQECIRIADDPATKWVAWDEIDWDD
jgi:hypothetical protein